MRDAAISQPRVQALHPKVAPEVESRINWIEENKFPNGRVAIRVVQGGRSIDYQNSLYAIGRTVKGKNAGLPGHGKMGDIVTKAKGGKSWHNYYLAIDFALLYDLNGDGKFETLSWDVLKDFDIDGQSDWQEVVQAFKELGWRWGGDWHGGLTDNPHLEKTFGYTIQKLLSMYEAKKFIPGTQYLDI